MELIKFAKRHADIIIVLALGTALRLLNIVRDDLWFDEAYTGILAKQPWNRFWVEAGRDVHPPLYSILLKLWTGLTGVNDFSLRFFSLFFGLLTIFIVYLFVKKTFNKTTAIFASLLLAISPFMISYSIEARSYSFYGFLVVLAAYFLISRKFILFTLSLFALIYTHFIGAVFIAPLVIYFAWEEYKNKNLKIVPMVLIPVALFGFFVVRSAVDQKWEDSNKNWIAEANLANIPRSATAYFYGVKSKLPGADELNDVKVFIFDEKALGGIFFILFSLGLASVLYRNRNEGQKFRRMVFQVLMFLIPQLILIFTSILTDYDIYVERYLLPSSIFFFITTAFILTNLFSFELGAFAIVIYAFTLLQISPPDYYNGMKLVADSYKYNDAEIALTDPMDYVIARYYFGENFKGLRIYNPERPDLGYEWWPFIPNGKKPENIANLPMVSPDPNRMPDIFVEINKLGDYSIYTTTVNDL